MYRAIKILIDDCVEVENYNLIIELKNHYSNKINLCGNESKNSEKIVKYCEDTLCEIFGADGIVH